MNRPRITPNGLPDRVRERIGKRVYRIYLDPFNGPDVDLYREPVGKHTKREARMIAIQRYGEMFKVADKSQEVMIAFLYDKYRAWQLSLPLGNTDRKAEATLETDRTHIKPVLADFGHMHPDNIEPKYWMLWRDKINRPGFNQMMALVSTVIEFGRLRGYCQTNTAKGIPKIKAVRIARRLTLAQIDECMPVAVNRGKQAVIQLLCARTAFLCAKRPSEILRLRKADLKDTGIEFTASKRKASQSVNKVLVEWSDELRLTVQSALAQASKSRICPWVFPTDEGKQYSRSGWGSSWARLMNDCEAQMLGFQRFTLRNGRAGGVTTKEARGDQDTQTLTQHSDKRMIQKIYDENTTKKATPAG